MCAKWHMRQQQKVGCSPDDLLLRYRAHQLELFLHAPARRCSPYHLSLCSQLGEF